MKLMTVVISGCLALGASTGAGAAASAAKRPASSNAPTAAQTALGAPMSAAERRSLTRQIESRWSSYVQKVHDIEPSVWARSLASTFGTASAVNLRKAAEMKTYEGMLATLLGQNVSDAAIVDTLAKSSSPLVIQTLGSPANDLVYTMVTPCRIIDTRVAGAGGPILADSTRNFKASAVGTTFAALNQGGAASDCSIPAGPSAVVLDVVAVNPAAAGFLTVFPYGVTRPLASSINYVPGVTVANEIIAKQTIGQAFSFSVYSYQASHLVVDVVGYFMAPVATALNTTTTSASGPIADGTDGFVSYPLCPAGFARTGGYCYGAEATPNVVLLETGANFCMYRNNSGAEMIATAVSQCSQVPGR